MTPALASHIRAWTSSVSGIFGSHRSLVQPSGLMTPLGHGDEDDALVGRVGVGKIERHVQRAIAQVLDVDTWRPVQPRQLIGDEEPERCIPEPPVADPADEGPPGRHPHGLAGGRLLTLRRRRTSSHPG